MFIVCTFLPKQIPCQCKLSWPINPFLILILILSAPLLANNGNVAPSRKLDWSKLTKEDMHRYYIIISSLLSDVELPMDALMCTDMNCKDKHHAEKLCAVCDDIVKCLLELKRFID